MFDNAVFVAMENQNYCTGVIVCGLGSSSFIPNLAAAGSIDTNYQGYGVSGRSISGCSAACYLALTSGSDQGKSDGYCPRASAPCLTVTNLVSRLTAAGLTWQAYCAEGCPRGSDHFPFLAYSNTNPGHCAAANTCSDTFISTSVSTSTFVAAANSANPPNFLWYTPTDSENMHDNSVSAGDAYVRNFLVGTGTISNPSAGSLFASNLFQSGHRTLFVLWWDENSHSPEIFYGTNVKKGYLSNATYDHYSILRMLEDNWNLPTLTSNDAAATGLLTDLTAEPIPLSASFAYLPSTPLVNNTVSFTGTAVGGTAPYTYSWNFGDGGSATGLTATHSYTTAGTFTTTLTVTDSTGSSTKSSQTIAITPILSLTASFRFVPTQPLTNQSIVFIGTATGGVSPYNYNWNFGDGNSVTGQTPSHSYATSGTFTVSLEVTDSLNTSIVTSQSIIVSSQPQLTANLAISPASPTVNSTVTFFGTAVNGISPYTFAWNFGDNSKATGATVTQAYNAAGTFIVSLNVTDNIGSLARTSQSITVIPTSNGGGSGAGPLVIGWGGISLNEVARFSSGNPPSNVFLGQQASDMESVVMLTQYKGMNGIRVSWDPSCTTSPSLIGANYTAAELSTAIQIASYYSFWIILDYHGYTDPFTPATSACWLSFWAGVTNQFKNSYGQIIWEPENEPRYGLSGSACSGVVACVLYLSNEYQMFINQTRAQGDTHWIIVENICSYGCGLDANGDGSLLGAVNGYPTVTDAAGHIFISLHSYLDNPVSWTYNGADAYAQGYYATVVAGIAKTRWPALNTEGGADPFVGAGGPNATLRGSAGYNNITLRFIQTLTNLYDATPTRIGYTWWTAGDWTDTPGAGSRGALQCNSKPQGWGCLLQNKPIVQKPAAPRFTLTFQGYDYDGAHEETITINNNLIARLPANDTSQNAGTYRTFALNITSLVLNGNNTLTFTHTNWDCAIIDSTKSVTITNASGTVIFSDSTVQPLSCSQSITYTFTVNSTSPAPAALTAASNFAASPVLAQTGTPTAPSQPTFLVMSKSVTVSPTIQYSAFASEHTLATST